MTRQNDQKKNMKRILKYLLLFGLILLFIWTMFFLYNKSASKPDEFNTEKAKKNNVITKKLPASAP